MKGDDEGDDLWFIAALVVALLGNVVLTLVMYW